MVQFVPLDISDEESLAYVLQHIDGSIQFGEDADVRTGRDQDTEEPEADDRDHDTS